MSVGMWWRRLDVASKRWLQTVRRNQRGAVFVEFLIAFLPVLTFFLCLLQLSLLFVTRLVVEHAATNAARAAAVVIGDEKKRYNNEPINDMKVNGKRYEAVYNAALVTLAPLILNGSVDTLDVVFPDKPEGPKRGGTIHYDPMNDTSVSKVRVRVEVTASCKIGLANRIMCSSGLFGFRNFIGLRPVKRVRAEAIFPYQGARYEYPP